MYAHCDVVAITQDGSISVRGWAFSETGSAQVFVEVDGELLGEAIVGHDRPDVNEAYPNIGFSLRSGFSFHRKTDLHWTGEHQVRIAARGPDGDERTIDKAVLAIEADANHSTGPGARRTAGPIQFFLDAPEVRGDRAVQSVRGFMLLSGWAFAPSGIKEIEVFVDDHSQGNAFFPQRREDIHAAFPRDNALLSGFSMIVPPHVVATGDHHVSVVVRDNSGNSGDIRFSITSEPAPEGPGPWQLKRKIKQAEIDVQQAILSSVGYRPHWTALVTLDRGDDEEFLQLRQTLESFQHQAYDEWRVLLVFPIGGPAVDAPQASEAYIRQRCGAMLRDLEEVADKVELVTAGFSSELANFLPPDGMMTLLSPGDRIGEDAFLELTVEAAVEGGPDFLYSDERRIDPSDQQEKAFFKPDWSPDLQASTNYIGRLWGASADLLRRAKLQLGELVSFGEYDAALRLTENAEAIVHVRKILCARGIKQRDDPAQEIAALHRAAQRRGVDATVFPGCLPGVWRLKYDVSEKQRTSGLVSIIIPTIASRGLVENAVRSIRQKTAWPNYEVILIDNIGQTNDAEGLTWKRWLQDAGDIVLQADEPFNWSRLNNLGAAAARGEYLLFINDDVEVLDDGWLEDLIEHAQRADVGAVGPQLVYPDGRVQHAGMFLYGAVGRHAFRFYPKDAPGPFGLALTQRNVIGVTGACMLMRRAVFDEVGGFNEAHAIINNDLDFALRLRRAGYAVVYTPHVSLTHHEMASRTSIKDDFDQRRFDGEWKDIILQGDPFFHPMLSGDFDDFQMEREPLRQFQVGHPLTTVAKIHRILAVKLDHIGDFVAAFPAFRRIKQHFPAATLTVLAARHSLALASLEPSIDEIIEFNFFDPRSENGRLPEDIAALERLEQKLAPMRFDMAVDLRRHVDTREILKRAGARWLAGFDQNYQCPWLDIAMEFEGDVIQKNKRNHVSDALVQLIDIIAMNCGTDRRLIEAPPAKAAAREAFLTIPALASIAGEVLSRPVVCVHAGAGASNKQWPASSFAGLIDLLTTSEEVNVIMIGGPEEADFAASILSEVRRAARVFSLVGWTSLRDLPQILAASQLFVGNDSGPKHIAAAVGVPTVGIHSGSVDAGEWGPMGPLTLTLRRDMACGPCYIAHASDCPRNLVCLTGMAVGDVYRASRRMLALSRNA